MTMRPVFDFFGVNLFGKDLWQVLKPLRFWPRITEILVIENRLPASGKAGSLEDCLE